jgi:hypothetical protein
MSEGAVSVGEGAAPAAAESATSPVAVPSDAVRAVQDAIGVPPVSVEAPVPEATVVAPSWAEGVDAEDLAFLANKGLTKEGKTVRDLVKIARHQDALKGVPADQLTRLPDFSKPEDVAEFNGKIGVPAAADGYEKVEVVVGDGVLDDGILANMSHSIGLRPDQHAGLAKQVGEWAESVRVQQAEASQAAAEASAIELKKNWGEHFEANVAIANKAAVRFDVSNEEFQSMAAALGMKRAAEIWHSVGVQMGEHKPATDADTNPDNGMGLSKEVAIARRAERQKDKAFFERMQSGDQAALTEWRNLNRIASS